MISVRNERNKDYYIDTDEIPGFFLLLKNHIFIVRGEDTIFIFYVRGYWCRHGYNMISQLQESYEKKRKLCFM